MIRRATKEDAKSAAELGEHFWRESEMNIWGDYPQSSIYRALYNDLSSGSLVGWLSEDGSDLKSVILFLISDNYWTKELQMSEIAWFAKKDNRGSISTVKMLKLAEQYAKDNNVKIITMGRIKGVPSYEKLPKLYGKMGFSELEQTFCKRL